METQFNALNKEYQLWKACGADINRPFFEYIVFQNGFAYATDAHIIVKIPLTTLTTFNESEAQKLNGYCVHSSLYKYLTKLSNLTIENKDSKVNVVGYIGFSTISIGLTEINKLSPPNLESIFTNDTNGVPITKIGIHQKYLDDLTAAMGTSEIKMAFTEEDKKIIVTPIHEDLKVGVKGIIMPIMTTGSIDF